MEYIAIIEMAAGPQGIGKLMHLATCRGGFRGVSGVSRNPLHLKIFY